jgi:hypothetical protein
MRRSQARARSSRALGFDRSAARLADIKNGDLLALAEKEFDAFITVDQKISTQQDLTKFKLAVLLLRARTNRLEDIRPLVPELLEKITRTATGALTIVEA